MSFKKFAATGILAAATLSPAFAQASDPCVVITPIETTASNRSYSSNIVRTKRIVDYIAETVTMQTVVHAGFSDGGSAAAMQTKSFPELSTEAREALRKQKPANCRL